MRKRQPVDDDGEDRPVRTKYVEVFAGLDSDGRTYDSQDAMWLKELHGDGDAQRRSDLDWYKKAKAYWDEVDPTVDGMLGGLGTLSDLDIATSRRFLQGLKGVNFKGVALDVGGGIGRVSKNLLLPLFDRVDILEASQSYLDESKQFVPDKRLERRICSGMEDFEPEVGRYDVIWIQWCIIYLTDRDFVRFMRSCAQAVAPGGYVCLKDNICTDGFIVDKEDSSITRSERYLCNLLSDAGVKIIKSQLQTRFPDYLFPVKMFALRASPPATTPTSSPPTKP